MEKKRNQQPPRHKNNSNTNLLDYLPRAASSMTVNFPNPTFTPDREKKYNSNSISTGFSGPMLIPEEIRRKPRKGSRGYSDEKEEEPNSPKVSCIGNIKKHNSCNTTNINSKDKKKRTTSKVLMIEAKPSSLPPSRSDNFRFHRRGEVQEKEENYTITPSKKPTFKLFSKFLGRPKKGTKTKQLSDHKVNSIPKSESEHAGGSSSGGYKSEPSSSVPSLGHMKRFVSGRHSLDGFDWTTQITPVEEEERPPLSEDEEEDDDDRTVPFSAPLTVGRGGEEDQLALEPRKEVNLWKRRNFSFNASINNQD